MSAHVNAPTTAERGDAEGLRALLAEGAVAGLLGAITIAIAFLGVDIAQGRALYTPSVLGKALLGGTAGHLEHVTASLPLAAAFTIVHGLAFVGIGTLFAWLFRVVERNPKLIFGLLLLSAFFVSGFVAVNTVFVQSALFWPAIVLANLLAAGVMGRYLWTKHPLDTSELL